VVWTLRNWSFIINITWFTTCFLGFPQQLQFLMGKIVFDTSGFWVRPLDKPSRRMMDLQLGWLLLRKWLGNSTEFDGSPYHFQSRPLGAPPDEESEVWANEPSKRLDGLKSHPVSWVISQTYPTKPNNWLVVSLFIPIGMMIPFQGFQFTNLIFIVYLTVVCSWTHHNWWRKTCFPAECAVVSQSRQIMRRHCKATTWKTIPKRFCGWLVNDRSLFR
jgi:hypothetical protein